MTPEIRTALLVLLRAWPEGQPVSLPAAWLLALAEQGVESAVSQAPGASLPPADLTVADLALRFGRRPSTIRGWFEAGASTEPSG